ncbi:MAG: AbrB/MazE/SpoVT family DNA-binding domain-containing protein [Kiritimatiellaeota bacterium]|nr:AbrB/MazE/SpoVT family DNA-binding domain-containing protein [Kiritimatiellota bacterium]
MLTERGQVSVPAEIRRGLGLAPGTRLCWEMTQDQRCTVFAQKPAPRKGAQAMLGFARTFRAPRRTEDWMRELRAGEKA